MRTNFRTSSHSDKVRAVSKWARPILVVLSIGFSIWFFYAVYAERNGGADTDRIGNSAETSKRVRSDVRSWFRQTFPHSAARADEKYGIFEFDPKASLETGTEWVFLAHGLDEPGRLWASLAPVLTESGYRVLEFRYPNDQPVHESSEFFSDQVSEMLNHSDDHPQAMHLIGHSMGGLVFRDFITHPDLLPQCEWAVNAPIRNLIQLGTPNHGSWLATYRLPVELRDHLFKDFGFDAMLGMIWDGAGEAQVDLKPGSVFLEELNSRSFPSSIYRVGVAGTGSPVDLSLLQNVSFLKDTKISDSAGELNETFPELFKGTGDGCVSIDSLRCEGMNAVFYVDATHRNMVRNPGEQLPPAIPIVVDVLSRD